MARTLRIAVLQAAFGEDMAANIGTVERLARDAAKGGAQAILPPELFQGPYFCKREDTRFFAHAYPYRDHPVVVALAPLARELGVVLPLSIFERAGQEYFNSLVMVDADGSILGVYRKSHIPDGPGYEEKFYFRPGDTGFRAWETRAGRAMIGHAVSNVVPVAAANRVGDEEGQVFYGTSFICDEAGEILAELGRTETGFAAATLDLDRIAEARAGWGFFRDRRPELYAPLIGAQRDRE
jgi:N-carbamoylputrescine amidase